MRKRGERVKKIIGGKIYDTDKAEVIFSFRRKYQDPVAWKPGYVFNTWEDAQYLKTSKGTFLFFCERREDLQIVKEEKVKKVIGDLDPDRFMELYGELEEG